MPNIANITNQLEGGKVSTKTDLLKGHHQVPVAKEYTEKTAIITPLGHAPLTTAASALEMLVRPSNASWMRYWENCPAELFMSMISLYSVPTITAHKGHKQHHLSALSEFSCTIRYLEGSSNYAVDALSRNTINSHPDQEIIP
ncbi:uncharacterized protein [Macrobrachium rosenbergii]|uniref:uncharacterized protein n=1 Tax=Macrobrachium rosenbergii TaxID=79674 RepID=UPI0034D40E75